MRHVLGVLLLGLLGACKDDGGSSDSDVVDDTSTTDSADDSGSDSGDDTDPADTGDDTDPSDSGDTSDTSDSGDTSDTGDTSDSGDTGDTSDSGDSGDTGNGGPNQPPGAPDVAIGPSPATTSDDLVATLVFPAVDPDGDTLTYQYAWLRGGSVVPGLTTDTVPAAQTARGQTWEVRVRAFDGQVNGPSGSASRTIDNAPPTLSLSQPSGPVGASVDLQTVATTGDADGDSVTVTYAWTRNGNPTSQSGSTVPASATSRGQTWVVTGTASDGQGGTATATATFEIANAAPTITTVQLAPSLARPGGSLVATATYDDADGDALSPTWAWRRDGQIVPGLTGQVVPADTTKAGETWVVELTVSDGAAITGPVASAPVEVVNRDPAAPVVIVEPSQPDVCADLRCIVPSVPFDADGDDVTIGIGWLLDGQPYSGPLRTTTRRDDTVPATQTLDGQEWTCVVAAYDEYGGVSAAQETVEVSGSTRVQTFDIEARSKVDVLFVVDNSGSMYEEQTQLQSAFPAFLAELSGTSTDWHVGVVTTDMDAATDAGRLRQSGSVRWITPQTANPYTTFEALAGAGINGSGDERGRDAAYAALTAPLVFGYNAGFRRSDAALGVVFLSDEEDYSVNVTRAGFLSWFGIDEDRRIDAIVGTGPGCDVFIDAGTTYRVLAEATGGRAWNLCAASYTGAMEAVAGWANGLPRRLPLDESPDGAIVVTEDVGGVVRTLQQGQDWTYDAVSRTVALASRPVDGSTLTVSYSASCDEPVDTGDSGIIDTYTDSDTGLPFPWPFDSDSGLPFPFPTTSPSSGPSAVAPPVPVPFGIGPTAFP